MNKTMPSHETPPDDQRPTGVNHSDGAAAPTGRRPCRPGRPPALDSDKRQRIIALLTVGCSRRVAARHVGCSPSTITRTATRDPAFADQLAQAETNLEVELLDAIRHAAKTDRYWRAAGWLLERKNPQDYARRSPQLYTPHQVVQLLVATLDSLREELPPTQRDLAIKKLGTLLLEFDPTTPSFNGKPQATVPSPNAQPMP